MRGGCLAAKKITNLMYINKDLQIIPRFSPIFSDFLLNYLIFSDFLRFSLHIPIFLRIFAPENPLPIKKAAVL